MVFGLILSSSDNNPARIRKIHKDFTRELDFRYAKSKFEIFTKMKKELCHQ